MKGAGGFVRGKRVNREPEEGMTQENGEGIKWIDVLTEKKQEVSALAGGGHRKLAKLEIPGSMIPNGGEPDPRIESRNS